METTLLTTGLACLIAAILGGGLKAFGIEIPALRSGKRQVALGFLGLALMLVSASIRSPGEPNTTETKAEEAIDKEALSDAQSKELLSELHQNEGKIEDLQGGLTEHAAQISEQELRIREQEGRLNRGEGSPDARAEAQTAIVDARTAITEARATDQRARETIQVLRSRNHQIQDLLAQK